MRTFILISCCFLGFVLGGSIPVSAQSSSKFVEEVWQSVWMQDQRVGYAQATISKTDEKIVSDQLLSMTFKRFGQTLSVKQRLHMEETIDGKLIRFTSQMENPPASSTSIAGHFDADELVLTSRNAGRESIKRIKNVMDVHSSLWPEHYMRSGKLKLGEKAEFQVFEPQLATTVPVTVEYVKDVSDSKPANQREIVISQSYPGTPPILTNVICSKDWEIQVVKTPLLQMELRTCSAEEALAPIGDFEFDFAADTMIKLSEESTSQSGQIGDAKSVIYRISVDDVDPQTLFYVGSGQSIKSVSDTTIELTVDQLRTSNLQPSEQSGDAPSLADYLKATQYLECDSDVVRSLAEKFTSDSSKPSLATQLESFVKDYVSDKNFSTAMASAAEVARSRSGDCTEHAVLLAAMLRAKQIPSRVAIGFVFSPKHQAFVGHMWTQAWLQGQWFPLDPTLGNGGTSCGHITVSVSSLSDDGPAPSTEFLPMLHLMRRTTITTSKVTQ